jgi:hypothetical protein
LIMITTSFKKLFAPIYDACLVFRPYRRFVKPYSSHRKTLDLSIVHAHHDDPPSGLMTGCAAGKNW